MNNLHKNLDRLFSGYYYVKFKDDKFKVVLPDVFINNKADRFYDKILDEIKFDNSEYWLSEDKRFFILNHHNIWNQDKQKDIDTALKDLDKMKIQLYKNFWSKDTRDLIKDKIKQIKDEIKDLHHQKYTFYEFTKESYATVMKNRYIIKNTVYYKGRLFLKDKTVPYRKRLLYLNKIMGMIEELSTEDIRECIHSETWKSVWDSARSRIFGKPVVKCNDEQKVAINFAQTIDNIRKHPKCPNNDVIEDSDALDGWILFQNEEHEKEAKKAEIESKIKDKNAGEVFVMAQNQQEIKDIMALNDPLTRKDIRDMHKFVQSNNKSVNFSEVPSMKQRIIRENKENAKK